MEQSALKQGKNFGGSEHVSQRKERERVRSNVMPRNLGAELKESGVLAKELRLMGSLVWIHAEEVAVTYCRVTGRCHLRNHSLKCLRPF